MTQSAQVMISKIDSVLRKMLFMIEKLLTLLTVAIVHFWQVVSEMESMDKVVSEMGSTDKFKYLI